MPWNLPVLTAVLLGMGVPQPALVESAPTAQVCPEQVDSNTKQQDRIAAELVSAAGAYLRSRAAGEAPDAQSSAAWAKFFPRCDRLVRQYASAFRSRGVDVDDCVQEVWSQLLRTLPDFQLKSTRGQFHSWLYAVVRSKANDILRQKARSSVDALTPDIERSLPTRDDDPATLSQRSAQIEQLRGALSRLRSEVSEQSYRVLHLRHLEAMSVSEVAAATGMSPEQVWARDHRMRQKLLRILG